MSPNILPFVTALEANGHQVHVVIPDKPLSWVGKAHAVGKSLTAEERCPFSYSVKVGSSCRDSEDGCAHRRWTVLDGPPASCTQIGLFHSECPAGDIDLVISGPNHGRNASSIYNLSSGTVGGALEGALCGKRSISVSFGSKDPQPAALIHAACRRTVSLIEYLTANWNSAVELYNVNVPMVESVETCQAEFTIPCRSYWKNGRLFSEHLHENGFVEPRLPYLSHGSSKRQFQWQPNLCDVVEAAKNSQEGEDLFASVNGRMSWVQQRWSPIDHSRLTVRRVTGLRANFAVAGDERGCLGDMSR